MFVVREYVQECGHLRELVREASFGTRDGAVSFLRCRFNELLAGQVEWPGVWATCLDGFRYTIDNNDGDFFEGRVEEEEM